MAVMRAPSCASAQRTLRAPVDTCSHEVTSMHDSTQHSTADERVFCIAQYMLKDMATLQAKAYSPTPSGAFLVAPLISSCCRQLGLVTEHNQPTLSHAALRVGYYYMSSNLFVQHAWV